ncbi:MAG: hypothetical protein GY731_06730 [Gammaproteobacteria bacterium]|nr:hypothetical protein [Gammaproteobacteria bacterium]
MRNNRRLVVLIISLAFAAATPAAGKLSFSQNKLIQEQNGFFQKKLDYANQQCGTKLDAKIAWETFMSEVEKDLQGKQNYSFFSFCAEPLLKMGYMCRDERGFKEAVSQSITKYVCKFGGKGKRELKLEEKGLTMWVDWEEPNYPEFIQEFLHRSL